jgi:hypothetical protein
MLPMMVRGNDLREMIVPEESAQLPSDYSIRLVPPLALDLNEHIH